MEYPTRRGIPIPSSELELPRTRLDLAHEYTTNTHHKAWSRRSMERFILTRTLRDLARMQEVLPIDTHTYLHKIYEPPKFPTVDEAYREVMEAYEAGESLRIKADTGYEFKPIDRNIIEREYRELK